MGTGGKGAFTIMQCVVHTILYSGSELWVRTILPPVEKVLSYIEVKCEADNKGKLKAFHTDNLCLTVLIGSF